MGFLRQEYWSGLPFPSPGDLPNPGIEPMSPALAGRFFTTEAPGKPTNGQQAHEKALTVISHQDNTKQNHVTPTRMARIKKKKKIERIGFVEDVEPLYIADENEKW